MLHSFQAVAAIYCLTFGLSSAVDVGAEMDRAEEKAEAAPRLLTRHDLRPYWSSDGNHLAYRINTTSKAHQYYRVSLATGDKSLAFDHDVLAVSLAAAAKEETNASTLPLDSLDVAADGSARFRAFGKAWRFDPVGQLVEPDDVPPPKTSLLAPEEVRRGTRRNGPPTALTLENGTGGEIEMFWLNGAGERRSYGKLADGDATTRNTYAGHVWLLTGDGGMPLAAVEAADTPSTVRITGRVAAPPREPRDVSPDTKWKARVRNHNIMIEPSPGDDAISLTSTGVAGHPFTGPLHWSPDSKRLIAFRVQPVEERKIQIVESSPTDQLQPRLKAITYQKPGDPIRQPRPHLFNIENQRGVEIDNSLFPNPWSITNISWTADSSEALFVYNERGHQLLRILAVRADSGSVRIVHEERSDTFIDYSQKLYIRHLPETGEIVWASERNGYNHLYLIDTAGGDIKSQITSGDWNVREVVEVDVEKRQLLLKIVGVPGQDPYHVHFARVNFDGSGFTHLTTSDGNHGIQRSPDNQWLIATWSRADHPPVVELRRGDNGKLVAELERADDSALRETGWSRPERFVAKARDEETEIHGIIIRPTHFETGKTYPVVEDIYAGPHDHFVPKNYSPWSALQSMAELGFIVVKIDGMGTNWRGKSFHNVAWKNLADSGFPDRIPWMRAAAESRPWMDLTRVGIYGGSAGGQSAMAALLHHGDFYRVGVADCGCHDNRMDKIWWNEAWMGWPVDESYERNSNVVHAHKLTGKLMLIVGELDTNVDPASTAQVVHALQRSGKTFDYVPIMNAGHGAAETPYGKRRRAEFLVRHLVGDR